ncbi:MAG TPA: hypothetical protein H9710_01605 [Candidatus Acutalibacter pullicola]|uniref:Uncharacterized protein n=1 Tax=Candidatus Acutalibacter pullicola TaxID=2838417 RepID=A0A9D2MTH0_9FIRM|nr:hypothetical protein [Candidatus Acutalibacter pullicola]
MNKGLDSFLKVSGTGAGRRSIALRAHAALPLVFFLCGCAGQDLGISSQTLKNFLKKVLSKTFTPLRGYIPYLLVSS